MIVISNKSLVQRSRTTAAITDRRGGTLAHFETFNPLRLNLPKC